MQILRNRLILMNKWFAGCDNVKLCELHKKPSENCGDCPIWHAQHYCLCLCVQNPSLSKYINALPKCTIKYIKVLMVRCSCFWKQVQISNWWVWSGRISISYWKCGFDYLEDNNIYSQDSDMTARAGVIKELKRLQADQLPGFTRDEIGELIKDVCCY